MRDAARRWSPVALAALFAGSGVLHLLRPEAYLPLVPRGLPDPALLVTVSGLAELVCAGGLVTRRRWAGPASVALLVAILPGNVQFAIDQTADPAADPRLVVASWLRLPLQLPMIWAALQARRG